MPQPAKRIGGILVTLLDIISFFNIDWVSNVSSFEENSFTQLLYFSSPSYVKVSPCAFKCR